MSAQQTVVSHTPGPWEVMRFDGGASWGVTTTDRVIGTMHGGRGGEANARLIAAAPDLLEAVKGASVQRDPRHRISMLVNDWQRILDAIAKAEGKS